MSMLNSVYVAWQSPETRAWHVVGNLQQRESGYVFNYTNGAMSSSKFVPFSGMDDVRKAYVSKELFPLFKNRLLSSRRPEYPHFIKWLGLKSEEANPIEVLGRSGGLRSTDQLQVFKKIEVDSNGTFEHFFFVHGLNYLSVSANQRASKLNVGESLQLCIDCQNPYDEFAVIIRADNPSEILGYCPRYFAKDIKLMLLDNPKSIQLTVEKISDDAPVNYRLLCKLTGSVSGDIALQMNQQDEFKHIA
ncbi:TPA: HIRAN domain-containing protein [Serratia marcescens]|uniref:HIRAN domain-containing protein n=1 Tax=Serratia marcescens TaxID=615 RepID=UPI001C77E554|nr:HIRAN domain-containing protein [Serratia marcescens]BCZ42671.1 restriction endonuclease [Serratia marcescens]HBI6269670.1 HIRAN domain-containing protein [Serratia marcescens]HBI6952198.1 HIRAN domain-containing protein [Serratia marcescens]HBI6958802.1 HIRAN domain-containing protein [Serratia marcescens]